jgi:hypothetical protein
MTSAIADYEALEEEEILETDLLDEEDFDQEDELDDMEIEFTEGEKAWYDDIIAKCVVFCEEFCGVPFFPYQSELATRIFESVLIGDGEEITGLQSRQSGKSETLANCIATMMVLFPKLAHIFPDEFGKFKDGMMIGIFAPTDEQAETIFTRVVSRLTSDRATEALLDPELDDRVAAKANIVSLKSNGSFCRRQTANPKAKIESKSYHFIVVDEAQDVDDYTVRKSIHPMLAFYLGTIVKIGTPAREKGDFYRAIQLNKRRATRGRSRRNHFEYDWRYCARYNKNYAKFIAREKVRLGEDSDEFLISYALKWLLDRGMFITETRLDELGDPSMPIVKSWWQTPVVVGIDPARTKDSTVVTVCWVHWDRPDEFGHYEHRILNWLEINNEEWEEQYFQIVEFLSNYNVWAVGIDSQGVGGAVAERLQRLMPRTNVVALGSNTNEQHQRWNKLLQLIQKGQVVYPAHSRAKRTRCYKRFYQQMTDLEKKYQGPYLLAEAPKETEAHDDYPDSLALACWMTTEQEMPTVEVTGNPLLTRSGK